MPSVLLVEDDAHLLEAVENILSENGYNVDTAPDGDIGYIKASSIEYDVVVLDVMMPGKNGYAVAKQLRDEGNDVPILMLTAKTSVQDKVVGFDCGADDYMTKPFAPAELLAHLRAILRRTALGSDAADELSYGDLSLGLNSHDLMANGKKVTLSVKEFDLMKLFMRDPDHTFSKEEILEKVWNTSSTAADNNVEAYISFIRKKLRFLNSAVQMETLRKVGYRLTGGEGDGSGAE